MRDTRILIATVLCVGMVAGGGAYGCSEVARSTQAIAEACIAAGGEWKVTDPWFSNRPDCIRLSPAPTEAPTG